MNIEKVHNWAIKFLGDHLSEELHYHNVQHTIDVWIATQMLCQAEEVNEEERYLLETAALFHDMGFIKTYFKNEPIGAKYAKEYLPDLGFSSSQIDIICELILATAYPGNPKNLLEQIICDSDLEYLSRSNFKDISKGLFYEFTNQKIVKNEGEWLKLQVSFLKNHRFHTKAANSLWLKGLEENLKEAEKDYAVYENTFPATE